MALNRCSECNGKVSDKAWMCPHCGFTLQKNPGDKSATGHEEIRDPSRLPLTQDEKRAYKRIQLRMMAKINQETARIYDISKSGMKLATPLPHPDPQHRHHADSRRKSFPNQGDHPLGERQTFFFQLDRYGSGNLRGTA